MKETPKGSEENLSTKGSSGSQGKRELGKNEITSKTSSNSSKVASIEKNTPNKSSSNRSASIASKQSKELATSKSDSLPTTARDTESSNKKETASSQPISNQDKKQTAAKKTVTQEKSAAKLGTKSDSIPSQSTGSGSSRTAENTSHSGPKRWGGGGGGGEKASQVTDTSRDVTGKYHKVSTQATDPSSPKPGSSSAHEGKDTNESREKVLGNTQTRVGASRCEDKNAISKDSSAVDQRNKQSPRSPAPQPDGSTKPGAGGGDDQLVKAPAGKDSKKPSDLSVDTTANGNKSDSGVKSTPSPLTTAARSVSENKSKKPSDLSVDATAVGSKSDSSVKSTPSSLTGTSRNLSENKSKKPEKDLQPPSSTNLEASTPSKSEKVFKHGPDGGNSSPAHEGQGKRGESEEQRKLEKELKRREAELLAVKQRLAEMEERVKHLEAEKDEKAQDETKDGKTESKDEDKTSGDNQPKNQGDEAQHISHKRDLDTVSEKLGELQARLEEKESQCERLMSDNHGLKERLKSSPQGDKGDGGKSEKDKDLAVLEHDLEAAERELEETREDNRELKRQVMEMRNEMDEMTDSFRESELEEFREMQRELEMASKNCRILQFKLRKSERKNIQTEEDRANYEEKLRQLEAQFDSQDARNHIQVLEEELRLAKEVSVRLHDELDIVEDKRLKAMEENRHLTELLEHTDKRQFRMEMEIDKLRDMVSQSIFSPKLCFVSKIYLEFIVFMNTGTMLYQICCVLYTCCTSIQLF